MGVGVELSQRPDDMAGLQPVHPLMVQTIENNLLLKQALGQLKDIEVKQDNNHLVAVQLRDHDTISRTDYLWESFSSLRRLLRIVAISFGLVPITAAALAISHYLLGWPK